MGPVPNPSLDFDINCSDADITLTMSRCITIAGVISGYLHQMRDTDLTLTDDMLLFGHMTERDHLDPIWKALADPTRRAILDLLRTGPRTTGDLSGAFPTSRFAVMKHLGILEEAGLVTARRDGRERWNHLNAAPIQAIADRWIGRYEGLWTRSLLDMKAVTEAAEALRQRMETDQMETTMVATDTSRSLDIAQEVTIAAPMETVFAALTQGIGAWWSHSVDPARARVELEPWVGGRFHEVWGDGQGALYATVTRIRTPDLLYLNGVMGMTGAVVGVIHFE